MTPERSTEPARTDTVAIIGIGNEHRHDDAAGIAVARQLGAITTGHAIIAESDGDPQTLLEVLGTVDAAIIIDAMQTGLAPGSVRRFDVSQQALPELGFDHLSSHLISVPRTLELARTLGCLPGRVIVYAIEGENFAFGMGMTESVKHSVHALSRSILVEWPSLAE